MIFPLRKFWTYSPLGFLAAVVWNISEIFKFQCPFAPVLFGLVMGARPRRKRQANS